MVVVLGGEEGDGMGKGVGVGAGVRGRGVVAETAVVVVFIHSPFPPICFRDDTSAPSVTQRSGVW